MSERIVIYCDDCRSESVAVYPQTPPRRVSISEYVDIQNTPGKSQPAVLHRELWNVRCNDCGKTRTFLR